MSEFSLKDFHLYAGDFALFINNKGLASSKIDKKDRPLLVRCMGNLEKGLSSAEHAVLRLRDSFGSQSYFEIIGAYLSPWQKFPVADKFHDPSIILPNIEIIPPHLVEPLNYQADSAFEGLGEICDALRRLEDYRLYADLIEIQLPENLRSKEPLFCL